MPYLQRDGAVFVLDLGVAGSAGTENRFTPDWLGEMEQALQQVLGSSGPAALVSTGTGKFYSNGLDLDWLSTHREETTDYVARIQALFAAGIVQETAAEDDVLALAVARAAALTGKRGDTIGAIKSTMYAHVLAALADTAGVGLGV